MKTPSYIQEKIYLPEKSFTSSFYESYHYQSKKEVFKPFIESIIIKRRSNVIVINIPGYNSDAAGYEGLYLDMAERASYNFNCSFVLISNKYFKGYDNHKILLEKGRTIIHYVMQHAYSICGSDIPVIYIAGTSAGGSCAAAIAYEFPLVKRVLLINPSGDVPESVMRFAIEQFQGILYIANGRRDFYIGPQTGKYLASLAVHSKYVRTIYLPDTEHSFKTNYSRELILKIPLLLFSKYLIKFPPRNFRHLYHRLRQIPPVLRHNIFETVSDAATSLFKYFIKSFGSMFRYARLLSILKNEQQRYNRSEEKTFRKVYFRLNRRYDYIIQSRRIAGDYRSSIRQSLLNSFINCPQEQVSAVYCRYYFDFITRQLPVFRSVRVQSLISFIFELLSFGGTVPVSLLTDQPGNNFLRVCRLCSSLNSRTEILFDAFLTKLEIMDRGCLEDQRFWKIIHSLFFNEHSADTFHSVLRIILHKSTYELKNDYFWLLLNIIIVHSPQPRTALTAFYDLGLTFKSDLHRPLLTAAHIASKNTAELIRIINDAPAKYLFSILGNEHFLELVLMISKVRKSKIRIYLYSILGLFIDDIGMKSAIETDLEKTKNTFTSIFASLQSIQNDALYELLIIYFQNASKTSKYSKQFWTGTIKKLDIFIKEMEITIKDIENLSDLFLYLKNDPDYQSLALSYIECYFELFGKKAAIEIMQAFGRLHRELFKHFDRNQFKELITTIYSLAFRGEADTKNLRAVFSMFHEVLLFFFHLRIRECNTAVINRMLSLLSLEAVPVTEAGMNHCILLTRLALSYENKNKLITYIITALDRFDIPLEPLRNSFDTFGIEERLKILDTYKEKYNPGNKKKSSFFVLLFESIIQSGSTSEYDDKVHQYIKCYNLQLNESLIITKFLKRIRIDNSVSKNYPTVFFRLLQTYTGLYLRGNLENCEQFFGPTVSSSLNSYLNTVREHLHTASGEPYILPERNGDSVYGLWRIVAEEALQNYVLYGHEIKKSTSRYTYLGLTREECFSLPGIHGFMAWIPAKIYNRFVEEKRVYPALREQSSFEVVITSDIASDDIRIYFLHKDLFERSRTILRDFSVLMVSRFTFYYYSNISSEPLILNIYKDRKTISDIIHTHQDQLQNRLIIVYKGKNTVQSLKRLFMKKIIASRFPSLNNNEIISYSLAAYAKDFLERREINPYALFCENTYRRGKAVLKKTFRKGFNEGSIIRIKGKRYFAKTYENPDRLRCEFLSWLIYREGGQQVKDDVRLVSIGRKLYIASEWINSPLYSGQPVTEFDRALDFVFSCFIQDRDQGKLDNYFYRKGKLVPFDFGGSFMFRSTGGLKGEDGQLAFSVENLKQMLSVDSVHFRKELYNSLRTSPRIIEKAMLHIIHEFPPDVIKKIVETVTFDNETIAASITDVLLQSRHYFMNRLAFFSMRQKKIQEIPATVDSIFDILNLDADPKMIEDELERRLALTGGFRYLLPGFNQLSQKIGSDNSHAKFSGYQTRIRASGRTALILEMTADELSRKELSSLLLRLGAESYEIHILQCLHEHKDFISTLLSICGRPHSSFFDKADALQKYILDIQQNHLTDTMLHRDVFTHDLLAVSIYILYVKEMDNQLGYKVLDRYRYYLSENLFDESLDI